MIEWLEIEVLAYCPECGHCYSDWISFDLECPFRVKYLNCNTKKTEGEFTGE